MAIYLLLVFLSGISALVFENLWFRNVGLVLGNSVWSSALVLAGFMAGLALGNLLTLRLESRLRRPLLVYAGLELGIGMSGVGLVLFLPNLTQLLLPLLQSQLDSPVTLNLLRLLVAFFLLLVPTTAMGATLPVLMKHLTARTESFGERLGGVYGANTLGAVLGVLGCEIVLVPALGIRGSGLLAAGLNVLVAGLAFIRWRRTRERLEPEGAPRVRAAKPAMALLAVAFLLGAVFLALEVVWFRFQLLFYSSVSSNFAIMLAVVLGGIALGGFAASILSRRSAHPLGLAPAVMFICATALLVCYGYFHRALVFTAGMPMHSAVFTTTVFLALPVSACSGLLFTLLGQALHSHGQTQSGATGLLTACNTLGAAAGSFVAGFYLVSRIGVEKCFLVFAATYLVAGLVLIFAGRRGVGPAHLGSSLLAGSALVLAFILFPHGRMAARYLKVPVAALNSVGEHPVAIREGQLETIQYLQKNTLGRPGYFRLVTNNHSMSATDPPSRRYMRLFANFATVLHPSPRRAALLCAGVGNTVKALAEDPRLEAIDVVDISRDVVEMAAVVYPEPGMNPFKDRRVKVHIEDGRFFLLATHHRYDIITGEPPPPHHAGVSSLYSREFFQLASDRLAPGGLLTYWLPVHDLRLEEAKAILQAFLQVFPEASLWSGSGLDWMMVGCKPPTRRVTEPALRAWWARPEWAARFNEMGVPDPEDLGALFIADGARLRGWLGDAPALTENWPQRINLGAWRDGTDARQFLAFMNPVEIRKAYLSSPAIQNLLPEGLRPGALGKLDQQFLVNLALAVPEPIDIVWILHQRPQDPLLLKVIFWRNYSDFDRIRSLLAVEPDLGGDDLPEYQAQLALRSGAPGQAAAWLANVGGPRAQAYLPLRIYCLQRAGDRAGAQRLAVPLRARTAAGKRAGMEAFLAWVLSLPPAAPAS